MVLGNQNTLGLGTTTNDLVVVDAELMDLSHNNADKTYNKR